MARPARSGRAGHPGQGEVRLAVPAVGGHQEREQGGILRDAEDLAVGRWRAADTEIAREGADHPHGGGRGAPVPAGIDAPVLHDLGEGQGGLVVVERLTPAGETGGFGRGRDRGPENDPGERRGEQRFHGPEPLLDNARS
jgi:hypothetical protein